MSLLCELAQCAKGACGYAKATSVDADGLEVRFLASACRDVRVTARVCAFCAFACENADAGHMMDEVY